MDLPQWMVNAGTVEKGRHRVEGREYPYAVLRKEQPNAPRWFIGYDRGTGIYFVSEEIPPFERELMLRHEMFEFGVLGGVGEGHCVQALHYELAHCPADRRDDYLEFRSSALWELHTFVNKPEASEAYSQLQRDEISRSKDMVAFLLSRRPLHESAPSRRA